MQIQTEPSGLALKAAILTAFLSLSATTTRDLHAAGVPAEQRPAYCLDQLDRSVAMFRNGDVRAAETLLQTLSLSCQSLPQIPHNLAVIAAAREDWPEAIKLLEQSLDTDQRASDTFRQLQSVHRYNARLAYRKALNTKGRIEAPVLQMQDGSKQNADLMFKRHDLSELHTVSTIEYELFDWWQSASNAKSDAWLAHYVGNYPPPRNRDQLAALNWEDVSREITFAANDAVVVLRHAQQSSVEHTLLLMRLQGNRWKIYQETRL